MFYSCIHCCFIMHTHYCFMWVYIYMMVWLTVGAVLVDLCVRVDLNCGSLRNLRNLSFKSGVNNQVVVLINAFELLRDGQAFPARLEGHISLTSELSAWQTGERGSVRLHHTNWITAQQTTQTDASKLTHTVLKTLILKGMVCCKTYLLYSGSFCSLTTHLTTSYTSVTPSLNV